MAAYNVIDWKFSPKALQSIKYSDAFINIWEGAVRSSKTVASIVRWLQFMEDSTYPEFLMSGKTESTCYRNIIGGAMGIIAIMGDKFAKFKKSGDGGSRLELKFLNRDPQTRERHKYVTKVCYIVGANDEKSENKIRGMTIGGWYADEVTLYPETFIKQAINRMSVAGAKAFWTTNPDSPYHHIKTEFVDMAKQKGYRVFHFTLDDNPSLPPEYVENLKKAYTGLWYKRMVLGLWVMADGVIYDMFNHDQINAGGMVAAEVPDGVDIIEHWVSVDYGNSNATVFLMYGEGSDGRCYQLSEWYHSGREEAEESRQKSPSQYAEDLYTWLKKFSQDRYGLDIIVPKAIYVDPSAKGFILELYKVLPKNLRRKIQAAHNDVLLGIEMVSSMIGQGKFIVLARCKNTLRELASYCWDATAQKRGEDKPLKQNDHTMDAFRYFVVGTRLKWLKRAA
jgi:PBSX family phage terminase large subunit